ncbi:golgin subfamily A member 6-like protein 7 [Gouania willdenowi]|uniref:golgin subfamily A member 6-like protein 7 n=1 Tax=Gouania willdenowi TaxID=441366 RepID=UPI001054F559|nr:golgin subfamily A member 6-like protein 7 [Gouania willdenowi]
MFHHQENTVTSNEAMSGVIMAGEAVRPQEENGSFNIQLMNNEGNGISTASPSEMPSDRVGPEESEWITRMTAMEQKYKVEIERLQQVNEDNQMANKNCDEENTNLRKQLDYLKCHNVFLASELNQVRQQMLEKDNEVSRLQMSRNEFEILEKLTKEKKHHEQVKAKYDALKHQLQNCIESVTANNEMMTKEMKEMEQKHKVEIERLQSENERFQEANAYLMEVDHQLAQQKMMEEEMLKKEQELEKQLKLKVELEQKYKAEIERLQTENEEYQEANAYLKNVEHQLDQQKKIKEDMLKNEQELEKQLKLQVEQEQKYKAESECLQREIENYQKNIDMFLQNKKEGERHNEEIQKENEEYRKENYDLKVKLQNLKKTNFCQSSELTEVEQQLKAKIKHLQRENKDCWRKNKHYRLETNYLKKKLDRLNNENWTNWSQRRRHRRWDA